MKKGQEVPKICMNYGFGIYVGEINTCTRVPGTKETMVGSLEVKVR